MAESSSAWRREAGAHDVDAVEGGLGGDLGGLAGEGEAGVGDVEGEVLGHLVPVDHGADPRPISALPRSGLVARDGGGDGRELALGGASRSSRLRRSAGQRGIAADDQPLARKVRGGDGRHVAVVEQRHLERAALEQGADRRGAQRGDPVEPGRLDVLVDARLGDHAPVADQDDMVEAEALLQLGDLAGEGGGIAGRAFEHLDGDRAAVGRAEQAVDDLQLALLAVAIVAELGERAAASLHVARGHVVEHQRAALEMAPGQRRFDRGWRSTSQSRAP